MNIKKGLDQKEASHEIGLFLGKFLRLGVWASCLIAIVGGILYLLQRGAVMPEYAPPAPGDTFEGAADYLRSFKGIFAGAMSLNGAAIIQLGVIVLISTPVLRVALSIFTFLYEKDYLYVVITIIVLCIILINMFFGLH